jgi:hypothetical protein
MRANVKKYNPKNLVKPFNVKAVQSKIVKPKPTSEEVQILSHMRVSILASLKMINLYSFAMVQMDNLVMQGEKLTLKYLYKITEKTIKDIWKHKNLRVNPKDLEFFNNSLEKRTSFLLDLHEYGLLTIDDCNVREKMLKRFKEVVENENEKHLKKLAYNETLKK